MNRRDFLHSAGSGILGVYGLGFSSLYKRLAQLPPVVFHVTDERIDFTNEDGTWTIWSKHTKDPLTDAVVGPGYIGRMVRTNGQVLVNDFFHGNTNINDPRTGGLGCFGAQLARRNEFYPEGDVYRYTWDLTERMNALENGGLGSIATRILDGPRLDEFGRAVFTVENELSDTYAYPLPIFRVRRDYRIDASSVKCATTVTMLWNGIGPALFIKEPKIVAHSLGSTDSRSPQYRYLEVFERNGKRLRNFDLWKLPDPAVSTRQIRSKDRYRLRFSDTKRNHSFNIIMATTDGVSVMPWMYAPYGFDQWAQNMNQRERFVEHCNGRYCLQGPPKNIPEAEALTATLSRNWEATRWASGKAGSPPDPDRPQVGVICPAWQGGTGYPDCLCASRAMEPYGTSYTVWSCYSYDSGWAN